MIMTDVERWQYEAAECRRLRDLCTIRANLEQMVWEICTFDILELYYKHPSTGRWLLRPPHRLSRRARNFISTIKVDQRTGAVTYDFQSKSKALAMLIRLKGWDRPQPPKIEVKQRTRKLILNPLNFNLAESA